MPLTGELPHASSPQTPADYHDAESEASPLEPKCLDFASDDGESLRDQVGFAFCACCKLTTACPLFANASMFADDAGAALRAVAAAAFGAVATRYDWATHSRCICPVCNRAKATKAKRRRGTVRPVSELGQVLVADLCTDLPEAEENKETILLVIRDLATGFLEFTSDWDMLSNGKMNKLTRTSLL